MLWPSPRSLVLQPHTLYWQSSYAWRSCSHFQGTYRLARLHGGGRTGGCCTRKQSTFTAHADEATQLPKLPLELLCFKVCCDRTAQHTSSGWHHGCSSLVPLGLLFTGADRSFAAVAQPRPHAPALVQLDEHMRAKVARHHVQPGCRHLLLRISKSRGARLAASGGGERRQAAKDGRRCLQPLLIPLPRCTPCGRRALLTAVTFIVGPSPPAILVRAPKPQPKVSLTPGSHAGRLICWADRGELLGLPPREELRLEGPIDDRLAPTG